MKKSHYYAGTGLALSLCALVAFVIFALFSSTITDPKGATFFLKPRASKRTVISELSQQGLIRYAWVLTLYSYPHKSAVLKTGEYALPKGASIVSIWRQLTTGQGLVYHPFAIIPGWTFRQLKKALESTPGLVHLMPTMSDQEIMTAMGMPERQPEGLFFPETYHYTLGLSDISILKRAFVLMQTKLKTAWQQRAADLPYPTAYEALIAASLIEKEAYYPSERPVIAGVLVNRLKKDMLLQFDPTVIYGLGEGYTGKIYKADLLNDTPFNTYVHKGLPPTPIAMPSMGSIEAALHPRVHSFYYFVANSDGHHQFTQTLIEHHMAVSNARSTTSFFNEEKVKNYLTVLIASQLKNAS